MAESRQYITQQQENGAVMISEDVISEIIAHTVGEVEGVVGLNTKPGADIAELLGKRNWGRGVKIAVAEDGSVSVDCNLTVCYGQNVVSVANAAKQAIISALESMIAIEIKAVNVNVCGISRQ